MRKTVKSGFTLVELLLVLFVVALLASLVAPVMTSSILRAREATLKESLQVMRKAIDDYYADNNRYPETMQLLVDKRYMRKIPVDPFTEKNDTWVLVKSEGKEAGIMDIRSGSDGKPTEGAPYKDW